MSAERPVSVMISGALQNAGGPLTVDEICQVVYGRVGDRERGTVMQNLHRLDLKGCIVKTPIKYAWREREASQTSKMVGPTVRTPSSG